MPTPAIMVVTGASGSGKTTAVHALEERCVHGVSCHYFDSVGVPSPQQMKRDFGSEEAWQATMTERWLERLATSANGAEVCVLDGQTRPSFVLSAAQRIHLDVVRTVLLDCSHEVRHARLRKPRGQPELVNAQMDCWAAYLRGQADAFGLTVIDTTVRDIQAVADELAACVETVRSELSSIV